MASEEAPAGKKSGKAQGKKNNDIALIHDVKAFASQLGLVSGGGGDEAFSDFAPSRAKLKIAPGSKPNKRQRLNDDAPRKGQGSSKVSAIAAQGRKPPAAASKENDGPKAAERQAFKKKDREAEGTHHAKSKQPSSRPANAHGGVSDGQAAVGDSKSREWNFGVGPRPGEAKGFRSLLGKSDSNIWHRAATALSKTIFSTAAAAAVKDVDPDLFERRRAAAEALMDAEAAAFEKELQYHNPGDSKWLQQVRRAGTSTDRLAAATLLVQESVVSNMKALDQLVSLATKKSGGKELVRQAFEALQELFTNALLPDRKLKFLEQQPLQDLPPGRDGEKLLLLWWTEDCVKRRYAEFVTALEEHSKDSLEFLKEKSMRVMADLLAAKPECEARLLAALVNKLGDPSRQVASKAVYLLMQLLSTHPVMKPVVVREVERFVFRPGLADKARYYAVIFLTQIPLSRQASEGGDALAKKLISVYFTLFKMVVEGTIGAAAQLRKQQELKYAEEKKKFWMEHRNAPQGGRGGGGRGQGRGGRGGGGKAAKPARPPPSPKLAVSEEVDARLLSGLITGVRRAFPFVQPDDVEPLVEESAAQLFRLVHTAPFTLSVQALMLMYQLMSARAAINDRYYRALYAALDREGPTTSSRAPMFLALLFKAMQGDVSVKRVAAFAKRLLQLAAAAQPNWACGALLLISQVLAVQPALWASITHPEDVIGSGVEEFKDADGLDDLTSDDDVDIDRFCDNDDSKKEPEAEDDGAKKTLKKKNKTAEKGTGEKKGNDGGVVGKAQKKTSKVTVGSRSGENAMDEEDDGAELAELKLDLNGNRRQTHALASTSGRGSGSGPVVAAEDLLVAKVAAAQARAASQATVWPQPSYYQPDKREPLYANADRSCWWELTALAAHAHPSVAAMARSLLAGAPVIFDGDPLRDLSLVAFLDKFVNKKPKPIDRSRSVMQPTAVPLRGALLDGTADAVARGTAKQPPLVSMAQLSSEAFSALEEARVESADLFFHRFLNLKGVKDKQAARSEAKKRKGARDDKGGDEESLSEADEDEVDRYLEKQEGMVGDTRSLPNSEYDYDHLVDAMAEDGLDDQDRVEEEDVDVDVAGEDVNVLDLPSPSDGDEAEEESDKKAAAKRRKRSREALEAAGITEADLEALSSDDDDDGDDEVEMDDGDNGDDDEEGAPLSEGEDGEEEEEDDELIRLMAGGSSDDVDADMDDLGDDDDDEAPKLVPLGKGGKERAAGKAEGGDGKGRSRKGDVAEKGGRKGKSGSGGGGGGLFASA
ncbi:hypothetical protein VaNZ11_004885, partial [Volvox africanus]